MEFLTVVNRSSKPLEAVWDGRRIPLPVGKSAHPTLIAEAAKRQNVVMGSEDPRTGFVDYLVGIEEWNDDCSPIEQTLEPERWDRAHLPGGKEAVSVVRGRTGLFGARDVQSPLPTDGAFVNPND